MTDKVPGVGELMPYRCLRALDEIKELLLHARTDAVDLVERIEAIATRALTNTKDMERG